jgi:hypothetical protein
MGRGKHLRGPVDLHLLFGWSIVESSITETSETGFRIEKQTPHPDPLPVRRGEGNTYVTLLISNNAPGWVTFSADSAIAASSWMSRKEGWRRTYLEKCPDAFTLSPPAPHQVSGSMVEGQGEGQPSGYMILPSELLTTRLRGQGERIFGNVRTHHPLPIRWGEGWGEGLSTY